jgi:hypothetical protein
MPQDLAPPPVGIALNTIVRDLDPQSLAMSCSAELRMRLLTGGRRPVAALSMLL